MVRDLTGVRVEHKSPYAKVKPKVSTDTDLEVNPKSPEGNNEVKDCEVKECTSEVPRAEISPEKQDVLSIKSTNVEAEKPELKPAKTEDQKANSPIKTSSETTTVGNVRKKSTPQKISDLTVDKQVCESPLAIETPVSPSASNSKSPISSKKSQPTTPFVTRKNFIDEDSWSMSSTATSARTTRSRVTTGVAPAFASDERIEKRKEYYAKLEEKRKALEAERREYEARTKEEEEAAIKQLRKTMVYKANPVPSFYHEKPPPKKELKKLPTTRAVSPKFGRRKSCSDAASCPSEEKICARARSARYSLGSQTERSTPTRTSKKSNQPFGSSASKVRDRSKPVKETIKKSPKISEQTNVDIAVQS